MHAATVADATLSAGKDRLKGTGLARPPGRIARAERQRPVRYHFVAQLLLVEDDAAIRGALIRALAERGHAVTSMPSAMEALQHVLDTPPDLILLDLGLPGLGGYEALQMMRAVSSIPVVVVTARDDEAEIIRVLDAGADDYVIKPFGAGQIDARIRAVLRRAAQDESPDGGQLEVGGLRLDPHGHEATLDGTRLDLSRREFDLLHYLALHAGQVVSRRDLLTHVWRMPYGGADKTVDVHVSWLRRKLGETAQHPRYLHTVRGVGIKLSAPG
jgi:two-component system, OmpR family, KDP operon response regulator KdpE